MKITMLGSLGNINRIVVPRLLKAGHDVTVITSNPKRQASIVALGAHAAVGNMADEAFLTAQFRGQDVVYLMISGTSADLFGSAKRQAQIFHDAVEAAGVQRVVDLSSIGAQDPNAGTLYAYHFIEDALATLAADVAIIRPTGFYNNLFANLPTVHRDRAIYANVPEDVLRKYVAPEDIATVVEAALTKTPAGHTIQYVVSDSFTGTQMIAAFSKALGFPLRFVAITDDQYAASLRQAGVPESIVAPFVKSTQLQKDPAALYADFANHPVHTGHVRLADFAQTFAAAYRAGDQAPQAHTVVNKS